MHMTFVYFLVRVSFAFVNTVWNVQKMKQSGRLMCDLSDEMMLMKTRLRFHFHIT